MPPRVLLIDDDVRLADMLRTWLGQRGVHVDARPDVATGLAALAAGGHDAVLLDVMLPDGDGLDVLRRIRAGSDVPVLMLTARGEPTDRVVGLELGADDYLPKPFDPRELLARIRAVLRRRGPAAPSAVLRFGDLEIDPGGRRVTRAGREIRLTGHQFDLLAALAGRAGRVMSREALMEAVRGESLEAFDRSIDVHVSRIRAAIEDDPKHPRHLVTVRGAGYVFAAERTG